MNTDSELPDQIDDTEMRLRAAALENARLREANATLTASVAELEAALTEIAANTMEVRDTSISAYDEHQSTVAAERPSSDLAEIASAALTQGESNG